MTEAAKEARRQYRREWNKTHKENIKRHQATYWEKKAREAAEATAAALTEDQSGGSSGSDPEGQAAPNGVELTDDQLRAMVDRKRAQVKGV